MSSVTDGRPALIVPAGARNGGGRSVAVGIHARPAAAPRAPLLSGPLRVHLSIVIVLLLIGVSVPLMWLAYDRGREAALADADQRMDLLSLQTIDRYRSLFGDGYQTVAMASAVRSLRTPPLVDLDAKIDFLTRALEGSAYLDGVYVAHPDGGFVHAVNVAGNPRWASALAAPRGTVYALRTIVRRGGGGGVSTWRFLDGQRRLLGQTSNDEVQFDPRPRPWYRSALKGAGTITVRPYVMATTRSLGVTLARPADEATGVVVGVDVLLETISHVLAEGAISAHATGYVFDDRRRLIVHSDPKEMASVLENLGTNARGAAATADGGDPALPAVRDLLDSASSYRDGIVSFSVGATPYVARLSRIDIVNRQEPGTIVIAAPLEDFVGESTRLLQNTLWISSLFLLAGLLAALLVARLVSNALFSLSDEARHIGKLEFGGGPRPMSLISEVNVLSGALSSAQTAIGTFALYVPRELVRRIVTSGLGGAEGAVRQDVTILFTDIRDFTTISEQRTPEEVVELLSGYFEMMNGIVEAHGGVIIQYLGDSIYAMWNAPTPDADHVEHGCRCALALALGVARFNAGNEAAGLPPLVTRFGLHTGPAVVGSVGATARRQYTAMGDTVNVASRLEGMNKEFGTTILASAAIRDLAAADFDFRALGQAQPKGRTGAIDIFELVGERAS
ncbi:MAG: adenylate/guanylate cyclase domain-containing protein [Rhizobiaceae bacterium]